jgi:hypothetical protein
VTASKFRACWRPDPGRRDHFDWFALRRLSAHRAMVQGGYVITLVEPLTRQPGRSLNRGA